MTAKVIYFHVSGIPTVDQSLITYSNMDTGFTHDSTGKMVEVTGAMIHFSTWSKSQFRAYQLGRNVLRGVKQWPPYRRIDQMRSALTDRISDSATAQGTATVDVDDLTALTTALTGQTRDAKMERVAEAYTLLRELEDGSGKLVGDGFRRVADGSKCVAPEPERFGRLVIDGENVRQPAGWAVRKAVI